MATKNEAVFDETVGKALALLEKLEENNDHKAEAKALKSSAYGFIMGFATIKGRYYGPKSTNEINKALALNLESGMTWMVKASSLYYTPEMFGGDKLVAEKAYEKSTHFFEKNGETKNNWMYLNALAGLRQAYLSNGKKEKAINTYKKALSIESDFNWVAKVLLPKAEKS
ncbi:MAG: tetratricopeptide (TPR) repeat protein [Marivirga sp.]|jgi:tetratricopeptide (TPR) repeat protein